MFTRRQLAKIAGFSALGSQLAGLSPVSAQDRPLLRLATPVSDLQSLDAHFAIGTQDRTVAAMVYNGLIRFKPGTEDEFEPDLAEALPEAIENEDGSQTWTFVLKEGVLPHPVDGVEQAELTVADILFSYEKCSNVDTSAFSGEYIGWTYEADEASREFRITVPNPISILLFYPKVANYSGGLIVPKAQYEAIGSSGIITHPVGTGPFRFSNYTPQNSVQLVAHDDYFRGAPKLSGVDVVYLDDHTARDFALETGDVQVIHGQWQTMWVDRINSTDGLVADVFGVGDPLFFNFNVEHEILQDIKVRKALIMAINRQAHVEIAGEPVYQPMHGVIAADHLPGGISREEAEAEGVLYEHDVEGAKALLAEAGYPDGFELDLISSEMEIYRVNYEVMQEEFRQIGVTVNLEIVQHATMHELIREGRNPITIYNAYRPNPDITLTQFFSADGGGSNFSNFTVDDLRDRARRATDVEEQAGLWREANLEIMRNCAGYATMYSNQVYARHESVDYGHELKASLNYYPDINETSSITS